MSSCLTIFTPLRPAALRLALATVLSMLASSAAWGGPWKNEPGELYLQWSWARLSADRLADADGHDVDIADFTLDELSLYATYGFGDRWTAIFRAPIVRRSELDGFGTERGVGDLQLGLQGQLWESGPWRLAARGIVQAPTGDETAGLGELPAGSGVWELETSLSLGRSFGPEGKGYGFGELGHLARGKGFVDGIVYRAELGYRFGRDGRWISAARVWGVEPYQDPETRPVAVPAGLGNDVAYLALGPSLTWDASERWSFQTAIDGAASARNIALGPTFRLGVVYKGKASR